MSVKLDDGLLGKLCECLRRRDENHGDWPAGGMPQVFRDFIASQPYAGEVASFTIAEMEIRRAATNRLAMLLGAAPPK